MRSRSLALALVAIFGCTLVPPGGFRAKASAESADDVQDEIETVRPVTGSGVHLLTTAIVHSTEPTATGMVQRSTETIDLKGDLNGRILYHPTSIFDFSAGTLVNTGHQVFSGTILGSAPVMLYDNEFRFDVNLKTGATTGQVHLTDTLAGPKVRCDLVVTGTGMTPEGNITAIYSGECRFKKK